MTGVLPRPSATPGTVHCLVERQLAPPRRVEVLENGRWRPAVQHGWRMYDDGTGWRAAITYVATAAPDEDVPVERMREARRTSPPRGGPWFPDYAAWSARRTFGPPVVIL
jgi:hypothetical protein